MKKIKVSFELSLLDIFPFFLIGFTIFFFFLVFFSYTVDFPINDDYGITIGFLYDFLNSETFHDKLKYLLEQCNEHRIVYDKIWTIISYKLFGKVNYNFLCFIGNTALIVIFCFFCKEFKKLKLSYFLLLPISILIFNITFWENMTYAMAGMSNFTVFVFSILSLRYLTINRSNKDFLLSVFFLILGLFTQGSAVFLVPISSVILFFDKRYKELVFYLIISLLMLYIYFLTFGYQFQGNNINESAKNDVLDIFKYFFSFLGGSFNFYTPGSLDISNSMYFSMIIGFLSFSLYIYMIFTKYYKKNIFIFSIASLIILIAIVTSLSRSRFGLETSSASRYRICSAIFITTIYFWFLEVLKPKSSMKIGIIVFVFLIYFFEISLSQESYLYIRKQEVMKGLLSYYSGDKDNLPGDKSYSDKKLQYLQNANEDEIYYIPTRGSLECYFPYSRELEQNNRFESSNKIIYSVDNIITTFDGYFIDGWAFINNYSAQNQIVFVGFKNINAKTTFFEAKQTKRFDLNHSFKKNNLTNSGYFLRIRKEDIDSGVYEIVLKIINDGKSDTILTDKKITIK